MFIWAKDINGPAIRKRRTWCLTEAHLQHALGWHHYCDYPFIWSRLEARLTIAKQTQIKGFWYFFLFRQSQMSWLPSFEQTQSVNSLAVVLWEQPSLSSNRGISNKTFALHLLLVPSVCGQQCFQWRESHWWSSIASLQVVGHHVVGIVNWIFPTKHLEGIASPS